MKQLKTRPYKHSQNVEHKNKFYVLPNCSVTLLIIN